MLSLNPVFKPLLVHRNVSSERTHAVLFREGGAFDQKFRSMRWLLISSCLEAVGPSRLW